MDRKRVTRDEDGDDATTARGPVHPGIICDVCDVSPIVGVRRRCLDCEDWDVCESCWSHGGNALHEPGHRIAQYASKFEDLIAEPHLFHAPATMQGTVHREVTLSEGEGTGLEKARKIVREIEEATGARIKLLRGKDGVSFVAVEVSDDDDDDGDGDGDGQ